MLQNYTLIKKEEIPELKTTGYYFEHNKTKAKVVYLSNEDDNKVFFIGFRTPAPDDTGVPHILEHSVLCGSRKFPVKDPFMELVKGSLQTFLNAMTFPDKTIYPVASRNDKDFLNLMNVYMDATLYPRIYEYPEILKQEGWHYQLNSKEETPTISGVVYNEMKGAFSSPESILYREILHSMFPDTTYKNESGGIPEFIPNLTQDDFTAFHKRYYHPSNSYIFLYGNGNIEEHLNYLHEEYLKDFDFQNPDSDIKLQKPFDKPIDKTEYYSISKEDDPSEKTFLSLHFAVGESSDPLTNLTLDILSYILLDSEAAPLKKALLDKGIGKDIFGSTESDVQQPVFSVFAKNAEANQADDFKEIVYNTLKQIAETGIDKNQIQAAINSREFSMREADFGGLSKGLVYSIYYVMPSWLYDKDPFIALHYEKTLAQIKKALTTSYLEDFIVEHLLTNPHTCFLSLEPKPGMGEEKQAALKEKMQSFKNSLTDQEVEALIQDNINLETFQKKPDTEENMNSIPMLEISDVKPTVDTLPLEIEGKGNTVIHFHNIDTNGIVYQNFLFNLKQVRKEDLPWTGLLLDVIGKLDTTSYSYGDLDNEIGIHTGGINFSSSLIPNVKELDTYKCFASSSVKVLKGKSQKGLQLLQEVLQNTQFTNKKRLKEVIQSIRSRIEMNLLQRGHTVAMNRIQSYWSHSAYANEELSGISYFLFIKELEKSFDEKADEIIHQLSAVQKNIFTAPPSIASLTCNTVLKKEWEPAYEEFLTAFTASPTQEQNWDFPVAVKNEGFITPGNVQYVAKGYNFKDLGYSWNGQMNVLRTVVSHNYLYENIRVLGGAYGAFSVFRKNGSALFGSYRDPNLLKTLETYNNTYQYLESFNESKKNMTKFIIGTIGSMDMPMTPATKGSTATILALSGITQEDRQQERDQVLQTTSESLQEFSKPIQEVTDKNAFCVIGNEGIIKENQKIFKKTIKLM